MQQIPLYFGHHRQREGRETEAIPAPQVLALEELK